jgi:hypothetical protein
MNLAAIESELVRYATAEKRRWQEIAQLLLKVERERLWEGHAPSYTAWLQGVARRADLQESLFWRWLKAGRILHEVTGRDELVPDTTVSPESLELADKIMRHAPKAVGRQVLERTLDGELSRRELREVWATYRLAAGGATARGRLPEDAEAREEAIAARRAALECEKRRPENRGEVRRGEMLAAFREASWLAPYDQARAETRVAAVDRRLAAVLTVRRSVDEDRLEFHGLWTCVSEPELADYEFRADNGTDFMWLSVPTQLVARAQAKAPHMLGILELTPQRALRVVRPAHRRKIDARARLELLSKLLQQAYLWP